MAKKYILAIDQGTTGSTVLIFDQAGNISGRAYSEFTQHYPKPGWVEHDAEELWQVTHTVIRQALENSNIETKDIAGIGITNQRETTVLWSRQTGKPVGRAIVWQDRRTASLCDQLKQEKLEQIWQQKTGLLIDPYFSGTKLHWLLEHHKLQQQANNGELAFGTVDSWLVWQLSGGKHHVTDFSNASRTLLYNIRKLEWDKDILARLNIPKAVLPDVKPSSFIYGETDPEMFFGQCIPIAGIAGDQQAALFGQGCYEKGMAKNTYGTGSFLLMNTGNTAVASKAKMLTTIAWGINNKPVEYALEGAIFITGAAIQWLRDGLGLIRSAGETEALANSVQDNHDVYFVPALTGLGAPHWDAYARGAIVGLTRGVTKAHLVRATLESIAYQTRDVIEAMQNDSGQPFTVLRVDGGAVANTFLMQFQSDMLNIPIEVPAITETTALGAAYLAGLATGFWKNQGELQKKWQCMKRYEPKMNREESNQLYNRWLSAVGRAKKWKEN